MLNGTLSSIPLGRFSLDYNIHLYCAKYFSMKIYSCNLLFLLFDSWTFLHITDVFIDENVSVIDTGMSTTMSMSMSEDGFQSITVK